MHVGIDDRYKTGRGQTGPGSGWVYLKGNGGGASEFNGLRRSLEGLDESLGVNWEAETEPELGVSQQKLAGPRR